MFPIPGSRGFLTGFGNIIADRFLGRGLGTAADPVFSHVGAPNDGMYNNGEGPIFSSTSTARAVINQYHLGSVNGVALSSAGKLVLEKTITANITASVNNYAPSGYGSAAVLLLTPDSAWNMTGFGAPSDTGVDVSGLVFVCNDATVAGRNLTLVHESASSDAGNRFTGPQAGNVVITAGGMAILRRKGDAATGRWCAYLVA